MRYLSQQSLVLKIFAAIIRRARGGSINAIDATAVCAQFRSNLQTDYQIVEITESIISVGMMLAEIHGLRGYDAIQLSVGRAVNSLCIANSLPPVTLVSADDELNAADSEGLIVENPNSYS